MKYLKYFIDILIRDVDTNILSILVSISVNWKKREIDVHVYMK